MRGAIFKMKRCCLKNIGTKVLPGLSLGEDGMAQRARAIAAFLSIVDFEDQLHAPRITEAVEAWYFGFYASGWGASLAASGSGFAAPTEDQRERRNTLTSPADATELQECTPTEYHESVRRGSAVFLLVVFSLSLIGPALSASNPDSTLPPCCRRDGKHHCAAMTAAPASPVFASARCPLFPEAKIAPPNRVASLPRISRIASAAPLDPRALRPQTESFCRNSFDRARQKRGPPTSLS